MMPGYTYHFTHRCVNKEYHLRFAKDRNTYRRWLRTGVCRYGVSLYGYCITSNHVHFIGYVDKPQDTARMVQLASSQTALDYNRRKGRSGAFWAGQYHCTIIEEGEHLWRCLWYVDLNMVRCGEVDHPRDWNWCSYHEFVGSRRRYRLLAIDRLLEALGGLRREEFREMYTHGLNRALEGEKSGLPLCTYRPEWSQSLAVGSRSFVEDVQKEYRDRCSLEIKGIPYEGGKGEQIWTLREVATSYSSKTSPEKCG